MKLASSLLASCLLIFVCLATRAVAQAPHINTLTPSSGKTGTSITVGGTNFGQAGTVTFNGVAASPTNWASNSIVVPVPSAATTGNVVVTVGAQQSNGVQFIVIPNVSSISPSSGPANSVVEVDGTGFGTTIGSSTLTFNGTAALPTFWSNTRLITEFPAGAATGPVVVNVGGNPSNNNVLFTLLVNGVISGTVSNAANSTGISGATIQLFRGGIFQTSATSTSNGGYSLSNLSPGTYSLVFSVSGFSTATVSDVPVNAGGTTTLNVALSTPSIATLTPPSGAVGTVVTILGNHFGAQQVDSTVTFKGTSATPSLWSSTSITVPVPTGTKTGAVVVTVGGAASNAVTFTVGTGKIAGTITQSGSGSAVSGASVKAYQLGVSKKSTTSAADGTYTLASLAPGTYDIWVSFSGLATTIISGITTAAGSTTTQNVSLSSTPGSISGSVTQSSGGAAVSGATVSALQGYTVAATATTDTSGSYALSSLAAGNYVVAASASGFNAKTTSGVSVTAGSSATANFSLVNQDVVTYVYDESSRISGVVDALGNAAIYNYDSAGNILAITQNPSSSVTISEFTPNSGPVGSVVTIYGTGFSTTKSKDKVKFNGVVATITSATATQIVTSVPVGATSGSIAVTVTSPAGSATSSAAFTVTGSNGLPTITSFVPVIAVPGTNITVSGTNYGPAVANNSIQFNGTYAPVNSVAPDGTSLSAIIPTTGSSGHIAVTTTTGRAVSSADLFVPPAPYQVTDVGFTGRMSVGGTGTIALSAANKLGLMLFDFATGHRLSIYINNSTLSCNSPKPISIISPQNSVVEVIPGCGTGTFINAVQLTNTGTYTLVTPPQSAGSASITLTLYDTPADMTGPIATDGSAVTVGPTVVGQDVRLTFTTTVANQRVVLYATAVNNPDAGLQIMNPDGTQHSYLGINNSGYPSNQFFMDTQTLTTIGTYTVWVQHHGTNAGQETLQLKSVPADVLGSITINSGLSFSFTTGVGQNANITFNNPTAQTVTLHWSSDTYSSCNLYVTGPAPSTNQVGFSGCSSPTGSLTMTNLASGTYNILVNPAGTTTGGMSINATSP